MHYQNIDELSGYIVEEINDIIQQADPTPDPIYANFAHRPDDARFNDLETTDGGFFLIVDGWDDVAAIGSELLRRHPFLRDESYCDLGPESDVTGYGNVLDLFLEWKWGFSDEYGQCGSCGSPMRFDEHEYIVENGEISCFDCLDDDYYVEEYLPYTNAIEDELASQENEGVRINMKLGKDELADFGYKPFRQDLAVGMHDHVEYHDPRDIISAAPDGYTYILTPQHIASFGRNPFQQDYEIWCRPIDY